MPRNIRGANDRRTIARRKFIKATAGSAFAWGTLGQAGKKYVARAESVPSKPDYPPARAATRGPKHYFFGYYDKFPWDATGRYLLAMEIDFNHRQPEPGEPLTLGMVDLKNADSYIPFDKTLAWCWQQGTMLQWVGSAPDRNVIYNSVEDGKYVSIIRDVHTSKTRTLPRPVYALSRDGKQAVSLDFDRVNRLRPGYGYMALPETYEKEPAPEKAGLYQMDLKTAKNELIIPLSWAAANKPDGRFKGAFHWFNHLQFNPSGTRFLFLHRWRVLKRSWYTRMYTAKPDGTGIRLHSDTGMVSHFDWRDDETILAWSKTKQHGHRFYVFDIHTNETRVVGQGILVRDGHCSYSPDRKWILNDAYPDRNNMQHLMLYRVADGKRIDIGEFYLPPKLRGKPYRVDLHPRWNRDGTQVCIDSAHAPTRQMYIIDVRHITRA